jgi:hypothetical protein
MKRSKGESEYPDASLENINEQGTREESNQLCTEEREEGVEGTEQ